MNPAWQSVIRLQGALGSGELSCTSLVEFYLDRISRFDADGPRINAVISLNPKVLDEARSVDRLRARGRGRVPAMLGIPFIAKDNIDARGLATSGGSAVLRLSIAAVDADVVRHLRRHGAVLLGKANLSELGASHGRLGYSSARGATRNPYDTARDVSGSSSGSAASVAADFSPFALGTDTSGSIRGPAAAAGLVGLRPTRGLISRRGVIPLTPSLDTVGPLTRTVRDAALILDAMAPISLGLSAFAALDSFANVRVGAITNFRGHDAQIDAAEQESLDRLHRSGATIVPLRLAREFDLLWEELLAPLGAAEFKPAFERYLRSLPFAIDSLAEFIHACEAPEIADSATPVNPAWVAAMRNIETAAPGASPVVVRTLRRGLQRITDTLHRVMIEHRLDVLVHSTMSRTVDHLAGTPDPSIAPDPQHLPDAYRAAYIASASGFPSISVPAGRLRGGLPAACSFIGMPLREGRLLALAEAFEALFEPHTPPLLQ